MQLVLNQRLSACNDVVSAVSRHLVCLLNCSKCVTAAAATPAGATAAAEAAATASAGAKGAAANAKASASSVATAGRKLRTFSTY